MQETPLFPARCFRSGRTRLAESGESAAVPVVRQPSRMGTLTEGECQRTSCPTRGVALQSPAPELASHPDEHLMVAPA